MYEPAEHAPTAPFKPVEAIPFGKYTIVAKLATGGMAEILLARLQGAAGFHKLICIKRILPHLADDEHHVAMFLAEAKIAALISHPNVCQVFELAERDGSLYIAMEYLEGLPLAQLCKREQLPHAADPLLAAGLAVQACEGLHHAHELRHPDGTPLGVVHRDVSPRNLFLTSDGVVKVLDFGIARSHGASVRTVTGIVKGTYAYMSPEQLNSAALDRRSDVFALGIVLWELLTQRHLFRRETDFLTFRAILDAPIPSVCELRPDVPPALDAAIARALSRDPADRYSTARELGDAVSRAVMPLGVPATPAQISELLARTFKGSLEEQRALARRARRSVRLITSRHDPITPTVPALPPDIRLVHVDELPVAIDDEEASDDDIPVEAADIVDARPTPRLTHTELVTRFPSSPARFLWRHVLIALALIVLGATTGVALDVLYFGKPETAGPTIRLRAIAP